MSPKTPTRAYTVVVVKWLLARRWIADVIVLAIIAIVFIAIGSNVRQAAGTAGFALIGAAFVRGLDGFQRMRQRSEDDKADRALDLSNTRMLIYIALASMLGEKGSSRAAAAGTLAHALAYHSKLRTPAEAEDLAHRIVIADTPSKTTGDELRELAKTITEMLDTT